MDTNNPVVRLCADGMRAEADGRADDARALFERAWAEASDDYESCVAAHYLARHQPTIADELHWNQVCLDLADAVTTSVGPLASAVAAFYPSLHACLARCHRELGDLDTAATHYRRAADHLDALPPGPYADELRFAVADGLHSVGSPGPDAAHRATDATG
ncbi:hypothetical protein ABT332_13935 [Saccharomonospora azurea]|uniref:hypothetical protein n=1 Tax=Saccharomonospora azurea TaxID=40988 RepID=UPI00331C3C73